MVIATPGVTLAGPVAEAGATRVLRLIAGVHAGAERDCRDGEVLLVGSGYDCDLVLADGGVGDHHCVVSFGPHGVTVRAVAAPVRIGEATLAPGEARSVDAFLPIHLGEAAFVAGPRDDPRWQAFGAGAADGEVRPPRPPRFSERFRLPLTVGGIAVFVLSIAIAVNAVHSPPPTDAVGQRGALDEIMASLDLGEARLTTNADGQLEIAGVIPDAALLDELKRRLARLQLEPVIQARLGEDIAKDVREVLRLSRLNAETRYLGDGEVAVRGYFPDQNRLGAVLNSPSMAAITGLKQAVVENLEPAAEPPPEPAPFQIASIITGEDPHIVGADGARYYRGATLPGLGTLVSLDAYVIYVDTGTEIKPIPRPGAQYLPPADEPVEAEGTPADGRQEESRQP